MKIFFHSPQCRNYTEPIKSWLNLNESSYIDYFFTFSRRHENDKHELIEASFNDIRKKQNHARDIFLKGDWEWFFNVDDDIVLPPDTLTKLLSHNKKVIAGLYQLRGVDSLSVRRIENGIITDPKFEEIRDKDLIELSYIAYGCLLLHRSILEKIDFKQTEIEFSEELTNRGIKMYCCPQAFVGHMDILYP